MPRLPRAPAHAGACGGLFLLLALLVATNSCRREAAAEGRAAAEPRVWFPLLQDMVVVKVDPGDVAPVGGDTEDDAPRDLFIDRFEVTDGEFDEFLRATGYVPADPALFLFHWQRDAGGRLAPREPDAPVRWVSYADALAYARWRGKELPTRAEWLEACPSVASGLLPWSGRGRAGACNSLASGLEAPTPVGMYQLGITAAGCYDMVGNVSEWTTTEPFGPEKRCVMGGSFRERCDLQGEGRAGEGRSPGSGLPRSSEEREALIEPWMKGRPPEERGDNVGFRCVLRDASKVVAEALATVERLEGADRRAALAELARAGVRASGENGLLPFVRQRLLERRERWQLDSDGRRADPLRAANCDLLRVASERAGGGDDLLLVGDDACTLLDGRSGAPLRRVEVRGCGKHPHHGLLKVGDGSARLWIECDDGELALVDWRGGGVVRVPGLDGDRLPLYGTPTTWCASDPEAAGDAWFVQRFDPRGGELDRREFAPPLTRVTRVGADGVRSRVLVGVPVVAPARATDDGLFLPLDQPLEVPLPQGRRVPTYLLGSHWSALRLDRALATTGTTWVADGRAPLPVQRRGGSLALATGELRFTWFLGAGGTEVIDQPVERWLLPTSLPATYLVVDGDRRLHCWSGRPADPLLPQPLPASSRGDWRVVPSEGDWYEPLALSDDGNELAEIVLDERPGSATLVTRARDLAWTGDLAWGCRLRAPGRPLLVRSRATRGASWFGVALDEPQRRFALALEQSTIAAHVVRLAGGAAAVCAQTSNTEAWVRDARRFELLDEIGVVRPPLQEVVVADLTAAGTFDPVLLLEDGSLVALRPADPELARLDADFQRAVGAVQGGEPR